MLGCPTGIPSKIYARGSSLDLLFFGTYETGMSKVRSVGTCPGRRPVPALECIKEYHLDWPGVTKECRTWRIGAQNIHSLNEKLSLCDPWVFLKNISMALLPSSHCGTRAAAVGHKLGPGTMQWCASVGRQSTSVHFHRMSGFMSFQMVSWMVS